MSKPAFTPGPWGVEHTDEKLWVGPMRAEGGKVADVVAPIEWGRDYRPDFLSKQEANAHLIASAPDLLQATVALYSLLATDARYEGSECMDMARAAISRARGEA